MVKTCKNLEAAMALDGLSFLPFGFHPFFPKFPSFQAINSFYVEALPGAALRIFAPTTE